MEFLLKQIFGFKANIFADKHSIQIAIEVYAPFQKLFTISFAIWMTNYFVPFLCNKKSISLKHMKNNYLPANISLPKKFQYFIFLNCLKLLRCSTISA